MEHPDFPPTEPDTHHIPDLVLEMSREDFLREIEEHRKSVAILESQKNDLSLSDEERENKRKIWLKEKIDLEQKEEALTMGRVIFRK